MTTRSAPGPMRSVAAVPLALIVALATLGIVMSAFVIPAPFTVDDNNYLVNVLALRQGRVTVANTEGLTASRELLFFDPGPWERDVKATPVASTAPPLYAPIALAFSLFKWRGLVALNTLAYLFTTALVFVYARRHAAAPSTAWLAAIAFALGGFAIEYALGVWPHALSVALVFAAVFLAGRSIETDAVRPAAAAGFLLASAAGVRYQNAVLLAAVGAGIFLLSRRRWRLALAFVLCAAAPLAISSAINHARFGSWNPISKGPGYLRVAVSGQPGGTAMDTLVLFWSQVVDYSARPQLADPTTRAWLTYDPVSGAHVMLGWIQKKSLLQSAPWMVVSLMTFATAWRLGATADRARQRQLRLMGIVVGSMLAVFSFAGVGRHDGLSFNQRYLLEIVPFAAVAFAWSLDNELLRLDHLLPGVVLGAAGVLLILMLTPVDAVVQTTLWSARHLAISKVPLFITAFLAIAWLGSRFWLRRWLPLGLAVGVALGWGLTLHLADDVVGENLLRRHNRARGEIFSRVLPERSALVAYWANRDAAVPLLFDRDIVILDAGADGGADAPGLIRDLLSQGRRVFLLPIGLSPQVIDHIRSGLSSSRVAAEELELFELRAGAP